MGFFNFDIADDQVDVLKDFIFFFFGQRLDLFPDFGDDFIAGFTDPTKAGYQRTNFINGSGMSAGAGAITNTAEIGSRIALLANEIDKGLPFGEFETGKKGFSIFRYLFDNVTFDKYFS